MHFLVLALALIELPNRMSSINFVLNPVYSMKLGAVTIQMQDQRKASHK
jgi:hypothetical protein